MENYDEYQSQYKSKTIDRFMFNLDYEVWEMEETIRLQNKEIKRLEKENMKYLDKSVQDSFNMIGNTINAILAEPKLDTVSVSILMKIKNMDNLEEIYDYIDRVFDKNREKK